MKVFTTYLILFGLFSTVAKADALNCPITIQVSNPDFTSDQESQALNELLIKKGYSLSGDTNASGIELQISSALRSKDKNGGGIEDSSQSTQGRILWNLAGTIQYQANASFVLPGTPNEVYSEKEVVPYVSGFIPVLIKKNYTSNGWWDTEQTSYQLEKGLNDSLHWNQAFKKLMQKLDRELPACEDLSSN